MTEITGLKAEGIFSFIPTIPGEDGLKAVMGYKDGTVSLVSIQPGGSAANAIWTVQLPNRITAISVTENSRIFVSSGSEVHGITRKGKLFFSVDTNLAESVKGLVVKDTMIFLITEHLYVVYIDGVEKCTIHSSASLKNIAIVSGPDSVAVSALILSNGAVRLMKQDEVLKTISPPSKCVFSTSYSSRLFLACENLSIYSYDVSKDEFTLLTTFETSLGLIEKITHMTADNQQYLVSSFESGQFMIYDIFKTITVMKQKSNTSIEYLDANNGKVLVSNFGGKYMLHDMNQAVIKKDSQAIKQDIAQIEAAITSLEATLKKSKSNLKGDTIQIPSSQNKVVCRYNYSTNSHQISVEASTPFSYLLIEAPFDFDLDPSISCDRCKRFSSSSTTTTGTCLKINSNKLRETIQVNIQYGSYGTVSCLSVLETTPTTFYSVEYQVKPLFPFTRLHSQTPDLPSIPLHEMIISGPFSPYEMNAWIALCLDDIPDSLGENGPNTVYSFKSIYDEHLVIKFSRGLASIYSPCVLTLHILRSFLHSGPLAGKKTINISIKSISEAHAFFVEQTLKQLDTVLSGLKQCLIVQGLKELQGCSPDTNFLSERYKLLLQDASRIENEKEVLEKKRISFIAYILKYSEFYSSDKGMPFNKELLHQRLSQGMSSKEYLGIYS